MTLTVPVEVPVISTNPAVQAHYEACRARGTSHSLAEMFALGKPPMSDSDREFLEGRGGCYDQFEGNDFLGDFYGRQAKKAGVDTAGAVYLSGLASYPGDPRAWVRGKGDVKKLCEERGYSARGAVNATGRQVEPRRVALAEDIVDGLVEKRLEGIPAGEKVDLPALREEVKAAHTPGWAKGGE
jgi:hypothetical protein